MIKHNWSWWAQEVEHPEDGPPEWYTVNESTREAVIASARREFGSNCHIALVEASQDGPFDGRLFEQDDPDNDDLLQSIVDRFLDVNSHRTGEGSDGLTVDTESFAKCLNGAIGEWAKVHEGELAEFANAFTETRNFEMIAPASDMVQPA